MRIFSESPLDRRDHTNRLSCHIIHEFRFSRIDFCSAARCHQRGRKWLLRPAPCLHGNLPRPLDRHGRANRALARRIILHANLRLPRVGFRPAARRRQCTRIRRRKEVRRASVRAKTPSTTRPALSRESPASTRPPRSRAPCPRSAHHANLRLPRIGFRAAARRRQCARIRRRKEARHASAPYCCSTPSMPNRT